MVDLDLEAFFDRVNHDLLMARVAHRVRDKRVLRLMQRVREILKRGRGVTSEGDRGVDPGAPGLGQILRPRRREAPAGSARSIGTAPTALRDLAAMETSGDSAPQASGAGSGRPAYLEISGEWAGPGGMPALCICAMPCRTAGSVSRQWSRYSGR